MMKKALERLYNGIIKENPIFVLLLGMCATLAVTTTAINGLGMGLSTMAVLVLSNIMISLLRKVIPNGVRMPAYIVIIATFVTIVQLLLRAYVPSLYSALGIFIPLIVVNCIILGRAEAYASKNNVFLSMFDGIGMGLGFTVALTILGMVRELFGTGAVFGIMVMPKAYEPISILVMAPGAFFVLAILAALQNRLKAPSATNREDSELACGGNCAGCAGCAAATNHRRVAEQTAEEARRLAEERKKAAQAKKAAQKNEEGGKQA